MKVEEVIMKPIVMIVGHGYVSGKKKTIDYKNYSIIFPIPNKEPFSLSSHNMIVKSLSDASDEKGIEKVLEFLVSLPTTTKITASHYKDITLTTTNLNISSTLARVKIHEQLLEAEKESLSSQKAWELLEYKIKPAEDNLNSVFAFLPTKNTNFSLFPLMYKEFIDNGYPTLNIYLNKKIILEKITNYSLGSGKYVLSGDNFVYVTPRSHTTGDFGAMLSDILSVIENMRILAAKYDGDNSSTSSTKKQKLSGSSIEMVFVESFKNHQNFTDHKKTFEVNHTNTEWYEFYLPDDSNILIGACGIEDFSF
jgi:hypothetical protein